MSKHILALVEGPVLAWARESAGYSTEYVAAHIDKSPEDIESWEAGTSSPYMGQLRRLAKLYKRPVSDFYFSSPPEEKPLPHDFRCPHGEVAGNYTPDLRVQLRFARERQSITRYLLEDMGDLPPEFPHRAKSSQSPEKVGASVRKILGIGIQDQREWKDPYATLRGWRERIEEQNILVFQFEKVDTEEAWGFSIPAPVCPVIGINKHLAPNARAFTMLHEFTHLLLRKNSVCDIDDYTPRAPGERSIEVFCNHVAAASLMPEKEFKANSYVRSRGNLSTDWTDQEIENIARAFGVSREAAIRRLLTFELTTPGFYKEQRTRLQAQYARQKAMAREKRKAEKGKPFGGQNKKQRAVSNLGKNFVRAVLLSLGEKRITLADAAQYLDVRPPSVSGVQELLL